MKNMKLRKILLTFCCAALLVTMSVGATFAYLTSKTEAVTNTFTVGKVAITLDEHGVTDNLGTATTTDLVKGNQYKLLPGHRYYKDPTVHVADDSEDCFVYILVQNGIADIEDKWDELKIKTQIKNNKWELMPSIGEGYIGDVYAYPVKVKAGTDLPIFEKFWIDGGLSADVLAKYKDATIKIQAYAVQADGMGEGYDGYLNAFACATPDEWLK